MRSLGKHLLVEFFGCDLTVISDRERLRKLILEATRASGATIVTDVFHEFNPYGLSGVVVIAESHVAIHTWPEYGCASLDIFTCGESMDPYLIRDDLARAFGANQTYTSEIERGLPRRPTGSELADFRSDVAIRPPYDARGDEPDRA